MSAAAFRLPREAATVLRRLRGESPELLSRELGVTAATLAGRRDDFLAGGQTALKSRPADDRDEEIARLRAKVGELTVADRAPWLPDTEPGRRDQARRCASAVAEP